MPYVLNWERLKSASASACGKKESVMLLDCNTLQCEYLPLRLGDYSLVITNCNKPHSLIESKYNERREETDRALDMLQQRIEINFLADLSLFAKAAIVLTSIAAELESPLPNGTVQS